MVGDGLKTRQIEQVHLMPLNTQQYFRPHSQ